jgi:hypothetical protein
MMESEDLLPPWVAQPKTNSFGQELLNWSLFSILVMVTFGFVLMFDNTNDGMKGNH